MVAAFTRILIAYDASEGSERALELAVWLAGEHGAALTIYSVVEHIPRFAGTVGEVDETVREQMQALREHQHNALQLAEEHGVVQRKAIIDTGHAAQLIVTAAGREQVDLLVLGRSGHSQVWGRFMGSTADKIVRHAPCSVLIAR
jgi:nucleotide-binding universal stress UspA family protein